MDRQNGQERTRFDSESFLRQINTGHSAGLYAMQMFPDGRSEFLYVSEGVLKLYETDGFENEPGTIPLFKNVHGDDLEGVTASLEQAFTELSPWKSVFRVVPASLETKWVFAAAIPDLQPDSSVIFAGHITDISDQKDALLDFDPNQQRLLEALESVGDGA